MYKYIYCYWTAHRHEYSLCNPCNIHGDDTHMTKQHLQYKYAQIRVHTHTQPHTNMCAYTDTDTDTVTDTATRKLTVESQKWTSSSASMENYKQQASACEGVCTCLYMCGCLIHRDISQFRAAAVVLMLSITMTTL